MSEATADVQPGTISVATRPEERLPPEAIEKRYLDRINAVVDEARATQSMHILVDVLAWTLACIIINCSSKWGAGEVLRRIGHYVCKLADREAAQAEADKARDEGQLPH